MQVPFISLSEFNKLIQNSDLMIPSDHIYIKHSLKYIHRFYLQIEKNCGKHAPFLHFIVIELQSQFPALNILNVT